MFGNFRDLSYYKHHRPADTEAGEVVAQPSQFRLFRVELKEVVSAKPSRVSISTPSIISLKEALLSPSLTNLSSVVIYLEGTRVDGLYCGQVERILKEVKGLKEVHVAI